MPQRKFKCTSDPDSFCYICGKFTIKKNRRIITKFAYRAYFDLVLGDQDKSWAPHIVCNVCSCILSQFVGGNKRNFSFGIPMVWREPSDHSTNCYFCAIDTRGYSTKNCHSIKYPTNLESAFLPVPHSGDLPVPVFTGFHEDHEDVPSGTATDDDDVNTQIDVSTSSDTESSSPSLQSSSMLPQKFNQEELSDLIRDLELLKQSSELLASRLGDKNMLEEETSVTFYRNREKDFLKYFSAYNHGKSRKFVYCSDINGLLTEMGLPHYDPAEWRLFIDSSKRSLKCVLLHIGNDYAAVPIGHSTTMKEEYGAIKTVLELMNYTEHNWFICVDLKMVNFLLGQQAGYIKYSCFLFLWDSRDRKNHWTREVWPTRVEMEVGVKNVIHESLVPRKKIIFPPLHKLLN